MPVIVRIREISCFFRKILAERAEICTRAGVVYGFFVNFAIEGLIALPEMVAQ